MIAIEYFFGKDNTLFLISKKFYLCATESPPQRLKSAIVCAFFPAKKLPKILQNCRIITKIAARKNH